jgi:hypothetical protein
MIPSVHLIRVQKPCNRAAGTAYFEVLIMKKTLISLCIAALFPALALAQATSAPAKPAAPAKKAAPARCARSGRSGRGGTDIRAGH